MSRFDLEAFQKEFEPHGRKSGLMRFINEKGGQQVTRREIDRALYLKDETMKSASILLNAVDYLELEKRQQKEKEKQFKNQLSKVAEKYHQINQS